VEDTRSSPSLSPQPNPGQITLSDDIEAMLVGLISAANTLALSQFHLDHSLPQPTSICGKCGFYQHPQGKHLHSSTCRVGEVLARIAKLEEYFDAKRRGLPTAADLDHAAAEERARQATRGAAVDQADGFGEPWSHVSADDYQTVETADGRVAVDMTGSDMILEDEAGYAYRIATCVNFCAGVPSEGLEGARLVDFRPAVPGAKPFQVSKIPTLAEEVADVCARMDANMAQEGGAQ
jgi:hypothetical protein